MWAMTEILSDGEDLVRCGLGGFLALEESWTEGTGIPISADLTVCSASNQTVMEAHRTDWTSRTGPAAPVEVKLPPLSEVHPLMKLLEDSGRRWSPGV